MWSDFFLDLNDNLTDELLSLMDCNANKFVYVAIH